MKIRKEFFGGVKVGLQELLNEQGISMYRLAQMSGVSKTVVIDICSGKSALENCTAKTVYHISRALGMSVEELLRECASNVIGHIPNA